MQNFCASINFLLSREKNKNVACGLRKVYLHHCNNGRLHVVGLRLLAIEDFHRVQSSGNSEGLTVVEVCSKFFGVKRGACHYQLEVLTFSQKVL